MEEKLSVVLLRVSPLQTAQGSTVGRTGETCIKFYSHQPMHLLIQPCISLLSYIKIT